jgi:hypothetical protein
LYSHLAEDAEFYTAAAMDGDSVVVGSRNGFVFLLDSKTRDIKIVTDLGSEIISMSCDKARGLLWIGGENGSLG